MRKKPKKKIAVNLVQDAKFGQPNLESQKSSALMRKTKTKIQMSKSPKPKEGESKKPRSIDPEIAKLRAEHAAKVEYLRKTKHSRQTLDRILVELLPKMTFDDLETLYGCVRDTVYPPKIQKAPTQCQCDQGAERETEPNGLVPPRCSDQPPTE